MWTVFVAELGLRAWVAPDRRRFWRRNWWQVLFLAVPFLRFARALSLVRAVRITGVLTAAVRGSRSAGRLLSDRVAWLAVTTGVVVLASSQLLFLAGALGRFSSASNRKRWSLPLSTRVSSQLERAQGGRRGGVETKRRIAAEPRVVLRVSGKRTLAKLNAFDFVVTVALGSTLATILLNSTVSWAEGAVALAVLAGLQFLVAVVASRVPAARSVVTAQPTFIVRDGAVLDGALREQRVAPAEVRQAVRGAGYGDLRQVAAVVLETDGTLNVIASSKRGDGWALGDVQAL